MLFPQLIKLVYAANYTTQLRKWYTMRVWKRLLKESNKNALVIDFGAGEAQYLVPFCKQYPDKKFYATDNRKSNTEFCEAFRYKNLKTELLDIEKNYSEVNADLGICIGVMQYLEQDENALKNINLSLKKGARFLLYVPINGVILTQIYQLVFQKFAHYESINNRKRVYTESEIIEKLNHAGFSIQHKTYTYGYWGKLSHEVLNTCSTLIFSAPFYLKLLATIILFLGFPVIILMMMIDFNSKKTDGNGILLETIKI
jgi:SAM-dependent methyltransferase